MNEQILNQAKRVRDYRFYMAQERTKMRRGELNPRIYESYEMELTKQEKYLCDLVIIAVEKEKMS